jgi:hypothetical protein
VKTGITAIYEVDDLGTTPARVNRKTGELYINMKKWADLSPEARLFVLLHEAGHVDQNTRNEILADNYAFYAYARAGKPLSKSIQALTRLLNFNNPQHYDRVKAQLNRAFAYDYHVNGNPAANPELMQNSLFEIAENETEGKYNNFLHLLIPKKKRQEIKKKIQDKRAANKAKRQAKKTPQPSTAQPGSSQPPQLKSGPLQNPALSQNLTDVTIDKTKNNKGLYIGISAAILVIIITVIYFIKKKH